MGSNPVAVAQISDIAPVSSKEFFDVQASIEGRFTLNLYLTGLPSPSKYIVTYIMSFLDTPLKQLHESNVTYFNQQVRNDKLNRKGEEILVEVMPNIMLLMAEMRNVWKEKVPLMFEKKSIKLVFQKIEKKMIYKYRERIACGGFNNFMT